METTAEYDFDNFVSRLNEQISERELDNLKKVATEDYNLQDVQGIVTFQYLFQELCEKTKLSRMELLKQMLFVLNRKDLINIAMEHTKMEHSGLYNLPAGIEIVQITARIEYLSYSKEHVQDIVQKLSNLLFAPVKSILTNRIEELSSGGYICVLEVARIYADLLQEQLEKTDDTTGLNCFGITDVYIRNKAYKVKGKMVPVEWLHEHQKVIAFLKDQNQEFIQRVDKLSASLDSLLPLVTELGDPQMHLKKLENLHKHSGMSVTLWKVLGKLNDNQLPERYTPDFSQEEIRKQSLYSKARLQRIFPQLSMSSPKKTEVNSESANS